jgi:hypothetical protein
MTESALGDSRLVDKAAQLEFMFRTKVKTKLCTTDEAHKVYGLEDTYITVLPLNNTADGPPRFSGNRTKRESEAYEETDPEKEKPIHPLYKIPLLNYGRVRTKANTNYCLTTYYGRIKITWAYDEDSQRKVANYSTQEFAYLENGMLATNNGEKHCINRTTLIYCFHTQTMEPKDSRWNYNNNKLQFRENNLCLTTDITNNPSNHELSLQPCVEGNVAQEWIFETKVVGPVKTMSDFPLDVDATESIEYPKGVQEQRIPKTQVTKTNNQVELMYQKLRNLTDEDAEQLASEHRIFLDHTINRHINVLAEELKEVYCQVSELQRHQVFLLAQTNGLLAARALELPQCDRIESSGMSLILQRCSSRIINITAKETRCGPQPYYVNEYNESFTIGKDGWSLHPFSECFWNGQFVNLNGLTFSYMDGKWKRQYPNIHLHKIKVVTKFKDIPANDLDFAIRHHESYEMHNLEQLNVISELMSQMQETNANSISDLVMDVQTKSNVWTASSWIQYIKYGLLGIALLIILGIIIKIALVFKFTIGRFFINLIPKRTARKGEERGQSAPMLPIPNPNESAETPAGHDHTDTVFLPGRGLFWKDMCPIQPV